MIVHKAAKKLQRICYFVQGSLQSLQDLEFLSLRVLELCSVNTSAQSLVNFLASVVRTIVDVKFRHMSLEDFPWINVSKALKKLPFCKLEKLVLDSCWDLTLKRFPSVYVELQDYLLDRTDENPCDVFTTYPSPDVSEAGEEEDTESSEEDTESSEQ